MTRTFWILAVGLAAIAIFYYLSQQSAAAAATADPAADPTADPAADPGGIDSVIGSVLAPFMSSNITQDPTTWPSGDLIWTVCAAVAMAEGYNLGPGAAPFDCNNPGDLSPGDEHGQATISDAAYHGGSVVLHFATATGGWQALYSKFSNIAAGSSSVYSPGMTWAQIASKYAGDSANWAKNVTAALGVSSDSTLGQFLSGGV
jgi:hypothetical protein